MQSDVDYQKFPKICNRVGVILIKNNHEETCYSIYQANVYTP